MKKFNLWGIILVYVMSSTFMACGGDDGNDSLIVNPGNISMYFEGTRQLSAEGATSWFSEDEFVATVNNAGLVKGGHVGTTNVFARNGSAMGKCIVTIIPKYNLYDNPILEWGASMNTIKSKETHEYLSSSSTNSLGYDYSKNGHTALLLYNFNNNQLESVGVIMKLSEYGNAGDHLLERYQPVAAEKTNYSILFIDAMTLDKAKNVIGLQTATISNSTVTMIMYMQNNSDSRVSMSAINNNISIPEEMLSIFKK